MGMLDGKTALVTGAGRGIGRGIALALAAAGAKVVVNDIGASLAGEGGDRSPADAVVREIEAAGGVAEANYGNVADFVQGTEMVEQVATAWGRIDVLVHVAGILRDRMVFNMAEGEWDAVIAVHLKGAFNTVRAASARMREQRSGRIIAMSSVSALGAPGQPNYAAADRRPAPASVRRRGLDRAVRTPPPPTRWPGTASPRTRSCRAAPPV